MAATSLATNTSGRKDEVRLKTNSAVGTLFQRIFYQRERVMAKEGENAVVEMSYVMGRYPTEAISGADHEGMVDVDATSYMKIFLSKHWVQAAYFLGPKTIRESLLDTPLSPLVAIEYVLSKQEQPLLGSEKKGAPIIKVLKAVSK
ncbi:hypothetical protein J3Q64DRAFT_1758092 [Phycomyces blakesleeanus]|uniref:Uncharacterized protein n=2 Tax=Phycomyces blakesleeanus TaxID=4837 RepID=A0A167KZT3_PHYB8|nr:hypothetical protein PHYBLDRAFT_172509 [Phycomyces blakesleeanus NRRL 1555(-)]OAD69257.1 hypothetical protein PHYBLDRAFT_172509 [Phycomyces blakesleeanus NRRL 1555(-)]|eukprot:XP_018287297.1 hypothetical protein PHYBLDRAFT_172509 [Phycomyces blakesleeanus NRRL 1555(-)]